MKSEDCFVTQLSGIWQKNLAANGNQRNKHFNKKLIENSPLKHSIIDNKKSVSQSARQNLVKTLKQNQVS